MKIKEQLKNNNNLLIVGTTVSVVVVGLIFWYFYLSPQKEIRETQEKELTSEYFEKVNINFSVLEGEYLKELEDMGTIPEYQGQIGKNNPFIR